MRSSVDKEMTTGTGEEKRGDKGDDMVHVLDDLLVSPIVRDGAQEVHVRVCNSADARYVKRTLSVKEVLSVEGDAAGVEDVCVRGAPGLTKHKQRAVEG